jgi:hypothetical protein
MSQPGELNYCCVNGFNLYFINISFLSVRLLIWKPVVCLKSATFLGNRGCVAVASFLGVPSA